MPPPLSTRWADCAGWCSIRSIGSIGQPQPEVVAFQLGLRIVFVIRPAMQQGGVAGQLLALPFLTLGDVEPQVSNCETAVEREHRNRQHRIFTRWQLRAAINPE